MTFQDLAARWLAETKGHLTGSTRERYDYAIAALSAYFRRLPDPADSRQRDFRGDLLRWEQSRRSTLAPGAFNLELNTLKGILSYAVEDGLLASNPADRLKPQPTIKAALVVPTRDQYRAILAELQRVGAHDAADTVTILACTGLRWGELLALEWRSVDLAAQTITVAPGKGKAYRIIPIMPELLPLLHRRSILGGSRVCPHNAIEYHFHGACRRLGLPSFHAHHSWRHYFATETLNAGVPVDVVAAWLGHKDGGALLLKTYNTVRADEHARYMSAVAVA